MIAKRSFAAILIGLGVAGCVDVKPVSERVTTLERDQRRVEEDLRAVRATLTPPTTQPAIIVNVPPHDRGTSPPITINVPDAQIVAMTASVNGVATRLDNIDTFLRSTTQPTVEGKLAKVGAIVTWLTTNVGNGFKIFESLKDAGLLTAKEAKEFADLAGKLAPSLPPPSVNIDLSKVEKQLNRVVEENGRIAQGVEGVGKALANLPKPLPAGEQQGSRNVAPASGFENALTQYNFAIVSAFLLIAAYLRVQGGDVVKARQRLRAEYAWLQRVIETGLMTIDVGPLRYDREDIEGFMKQTRGRIQDRRCAYCTLVWAEFSTLVVSLLLVVQVLWPSHLLSLVLSFAVLGIVIFLIALHVYLWRKTGRNPAKWETWPMDNAELRRTVPKVPDGLKA